MPSQEYTDAKLGEYDNAGARPKKGGKVKRHCARFWWLYLVLIVVVILVVVLPLIFVGYPRRAQKGIDQAQLVPSAQIIRNPAADSADLTLNSVLLSTASQHPNLESFNGSFYLEGQEKPFVTVTIPAMKAENGAVASIQQRISISDLDAFTMYTTTLLATKSFRVNLRGSGGLKQGGLHRITVNYNQTVELTGLNALHGLEINSFRLAGEEALPFGANSFGSAIIPNPSITSAEFGNVTLTMFVGETSIGNATMPDFTLEPGDKAYPLYATANTTAIAELLQQPRYRCGILPLSIKGNQSVFDGQVIPYFTTPLRLATITTTFNLTDTLNAAGVGQLITGECET